MYFNMLLHFACIAAFASREMLLPDIGMVHGRFVVAAWESGLEDVDDSAIRLIMVAIEVKTVSYKI